MRPEMIWIHMPTVYQRCTALYYTVLHCTVLYCTALYCTVLCVYVKEKPEKLNHATTQHQHRRD